MIKEQEARKSGLVEQATQTETKSLLKSYPNAAGLQAIKSASEASPEHQGESPSERTAAKDIAQTCRITLNRNRFQTLTLTLTLILTVKAVKDAVDAEAEAVKEKTAALEELTFVRSELRMVEHICATLRNALADARLQHNKTVKERYYHPCF